VVVGPYEHYDIGDGVVADLYLLRYDEHGRLQSPQTEQLLRTAISEQPASDVFLFSHGWNNTFEVAAKRYRDFITGYMRQRAQFGIPLPAAYRPVLVGVIWPSTSFVFPWENGPTIAAAPVDDSSQTEEMLRLLSGGLDPESSATFVERVDGREVVDKVDAEAAAEALISALWPGNDPDDGSNPPTVDEVINAWQSLEGNTTAGSVSTGGFGTVGRAAPAAAPVAAGFSLDPRDLLRLGTVWKMKGRAGTIGATGVAPLVRHVLDETDARLHMIGHSFGARVMLSALAIGDPPTRNARSMLLLEPAVNRWCFAPKVVGSDTPGGYYPVLTRVELPVFSTFSKYDIPLHDVFHIAVRGSSLGEPAIAAVDDTYRYGALGGFGPEGLDGLSTVEQARPAGSEPYPMPDKVRVVAIDGGIDLGGTPAIAGHGDINSPITWWALHCLTSAAGA
jgi:hypothetical protein